MGATHRRPFWAPADLPANKTPALPLEQQRNSCALSAAARDRVGRPNLVKESLRLVHRQPDLLSHRNFRTGGDRILACDLFRRRRTRAGADGEQILRLHHGATELFRDRMLDFDGINRAVGTAEMIELGRQYDISALPGSPDGAKRNPGTPVQ
jgi:hypothetical protein